MFCLVDINNAYASFERVFNPGLVGRPLVVLSSNDGACIARSNEAKDLGVKMAQPWFQVKHLQATAGLVAVSANFELYADMSSRMMSVVGRYAPRQEVYSIDESFLDFEGVNADLAAIGRDLRATVLREVGVPTSVGFGPTKTLAKLANHMAKTADRKPGTYPAAWAQVLNFADLSAAELASCFAATEVSNVWGVGRRISEKLEAMKIRTVLDLVRANPAVLRREFNVVLEKTVRELQGTSCIDLDDMPASKQQILVSRSFGTAITTVDGIIEATTEFASRAAEKLRAQGSVAGSVGVFFSTSPFRAHDRQHQVNVTIPLTTPTSDTRVLCAAVATTVRCQFRAGFNYAKAGAVMIDLRPAGQTQGELDLFSASDEHQRRQAKSRDALMEAMDALNHRFGRDAVRIGSAMAASSAKPQRIWATKQDLRSPRYTTRWDEMLEVRC